MSDTAASRDGYQVCDPLAPDDYQALRQSIIERGVEVPIVVDERGAVIDGHNRQRIAYELHIDCPKDVRPGLTDEQKEALAFELNRARRQMTAEQKRRIQLRILGRGGSVREAADATGVDRRTVERHLRSVSTGADAPIDTAGPVLLPQERKRAEIADAIAADPEKSDRQIARETRAGNATVSRLRKQAAAPAAPTKPSARKRRPITDAYRDHVRIIGKQADALVRLCADDRFAQHRGTLRDMGRGNLIRARDALDRAIQQLEKETA